MADPKTKKAAISWKQVAVVAWLVFALALASWWLIYGLSQLDRIAELAGQVPSASTDEIARNHRMLMSEGATLILLLLGGGAALLYHIRQESLRSRRLKEFFAAFTHDLKTSLASLRLQAESLEEDLKATQDAKLMRRLVKDTVRLELQLENALLISSPQDSAQFFAEPIRLSEVFEPLRYISPDLQLVIQGDALVECDQRAIDSIFKNLLQNALVHGRATRVTIEVSNQSERAVVRVKDDGRGFKGDIDQLGQEMFERHGPTSGSGIGLYLAKRLALKMRGELRFVNVASGFVAELSLPLAREVKNPAHASALSEADAE